MSFRRVSEVDVATLTFAWHSSVLYEKGALSIVSFYVVIQWTELVQRHASETHLSVSVTEGDGDHEPLQAVEGHVEVLVEGLPGAVGARLRPVEGEEPVEAEERQQDHRRVNRFPVVMGFA